MNTASSVYKELSKAELERVMHSVFPSETIRSYALLSGGLFNTTYRVETEGHDAVLRMGPVHRELLLPYEQNLMAAECETDRLCHAHGIPASTVLHLDTSKTVIDRDFMVVERLESLPLNDPSFAQTVREQIHRECGVMMRKMHTITAPRFGRLADTVAGKGYESWYDAIREEFVKLFATARPYSIFPAGVEDVAFAYVYERKPILDRITVPRLTHCDLWDGNILVQKRNGQDILCAIIDGDRAMFGDVDLDISRVWGENEAFMSGYGEIVSAFSPEETKEKRNVYRVMLDLIDAYVWVVEYHNTSAYERTRDRALQTLGMI